MSLDTDFDPDYQQFVQTIVENRKIYTLLDDEDFYAECPSETYDDDLGGALIVYCFWENQEKAQACQQDEWRNYQITAIDLEGFLDILMDMDLDDRLVGVSFDAQLYGSEIDPMELLSSLLDEMQNRHLQHEYESWEKWQRHRQKWESEIRLAHTVH